MTDFLQYLNTMLQGALGVLLGATNLGISTTTTPAASSYQPGTLLDGGYDYINTLINLSNQTGSSIEPINTNNNPPVYTGPSTVHYNGPFVIPTIPQAGISIPYYTPPSNPGQPGSERGDGSGSSGGGGGNLGNGWIKITQLQEPPFTQSLNLYITINPPTSFYSSAAPYFFWDSTTSLINLVYPWALYNNNIYIIVHNSLFSLISSFPFINEGASINGSVVPTGYVALNIPNNLGNTLRMDPMYPNTNAYTGTAPNGTSYNSFLITQEYNTSYNFYNIRKVTIKTSMPFRQEMLPNLDTANVGGQVILTDYDVPINKWGDLDQTLYYIPSVYDRWVDIITTKEINKISFNFQYEDLFGNLNDILLQPGQMATIKLLFKNS